MEDYVVKAGDNVSKIAQALGSDVASIVKANNLSNPDLIMPGQVLKIPKGTVPNPDPASLAGTLPLGGSGNASGGDKTLPSATTEADQLTLLRSALQTASEKASAVNTEAGMSSALSGARSVAGSDAAFGGSNISGLIDFVSNRAKTDVSTQFKNLSDVLTSIENNRKAASDSAQKQKDDARSMISQSIQGGWWNSMPDDAKQKLWEDAGYTGSAQNQTTSNKPPTAAETKALGYYDRGSNALDVIDKIESSVVNGNFFEQLQNRWAPSFLQSSDQQVYNQAKRQFIEAYLRRDSGAAISASEYDNADKTYFAQPGDTAEVLKNKEAARTAVLDSIKTEAGNAYAQAHPDENQSGGGGSGGNSGVNTGAQDVANKIRQAESSGISPGDIINELLQPASPVRAQILHYQDAHATPEEILNHLKAQGDAGKEIVAGYDITSYATDPSHGTKVQKIYDSMPTISSVADADRYIQKVAPGSLVRGQDVIASAKAQGVDPKMILAIMQQDSTFATKGKAVRTNNPGNVGNTDSGATKAFSNMGEGVMAVAMNLAKRKLS